jgi:hypothetical protein
MNDSAEQSLWIDWAVFMPQCAPGGGATYFTGFLNSHTAPAQKNASTAVHRKMST